MKKLLLLFAFCLNLFANAQYTKLLDFAGTTNGSAPNGDLISVGNFLYGMTYAGGTSTNCPGGCGTIFKIKFDGTGYDTLLNFNNTNGANPNGSLISDGTFFYGMTKGGGTNGYGTVFKIKLDGTGYLKLLDLGNVNRQYPHGSLFYDGFFLYGMTWQGGNYGQGTLFKIKPDGTGDTVLLNFSGSTGSQPKASLISDGTFLYGTIDGGINSAGVIFKIKPDGTGYVDLRDFVGWPTDGMGPQGSLVSDGTFLYGMTFGGGINNGANGTIYKIKLDGTGYDTVLCFRGPNGKYPYGSLIFDGSFLYGMTSSGSGISGDGTIFKIKPDGSEYSQLLNFAGTSNGSTPNGSLISDGIFLYGMTSAGGTNNKGVIFKYHDIGLSAVMLGTPVCNGQCIGSASASISHGIPPYTYSWSTLPLQTTSTAIGLCSGITYTVTVTDSVGSASDTVTIAPLPQPTAPLICMVSTDSLSINNLIFWDKTPYTSADSFIVYRYDVISSGYLRIGSVSKDSLSEFTDTAFSIGGPNGGNPQYASWKYKLAIRDTCGNLSAKSPYHESVFEQENNSNFSWNAYTIEAGQSNPVTGYSFSRDDNNTGNWHVLVNTSGLSTTDPNFTSFPNANWRVYALGFNCTPTYRLGNNGSQTAIVKSRSNVRNNRGFGFNPITNNNHIKIYPNPANDELTISLPIAIGSKNYSDCKIEIINILGEQIAPSAFGILPKGEKFTADISSLQNGVYFVKVISNGSSFLQKLIVQH